jgi:hypothetical protein
MPWRNLRKRVWPASTKQAASDAAAATGEKDIIVIADDDLKRLRDEREKIERNAMSDQPG